MIPSPACPLHGATMIHVRQHAGRDWWHCSKCSVEIDEPTAAPDAASPGFAGGQDALSAALATLDPLPGIAAPERDFRDL
jgi:hypothetical protein